MSRVEVIVKGGGIWAGGLRWLEWLLLQKGQVKWSSDSVCLAGPAYPRIKVKREQGRACGQLADLARRGKRRKRREEESGR